MRFDWGLEGIWVVITGEYHRSAWKWGSGYYECEACDRTFYVSECDPGVLEEMGLGKLYHLGDEEGWQFNCGPCEDRLQEAYDAARAEGWF